MAPNPRRVDARLEDLYAELPKIECKGKCFDSCGPIDMSVRERRRIEEVSGPVTCNGLTCSKLINNRCSVYALRPMICRLWGLIEAMPCHHGCRPEGGLIPDLEGFRLLARSMEIGGGPSMADQGLVRGLERIAAELTEAEFRQRVREYAAATIPKPRRKDERSSANA